MESPMELLADDLTLRPSFCGEDFPDRRLAHRAYRTQVAMARAAMHRTPGTPALRKGASRFAHNRRIAADDLLDASARHAPKPWIDQPVLLSCEDSTYTRFDNEDAGPLRSGHDRGYVVHLSFAVLPDTAMPCGWLGACVWTRHDTPCRDQDHRQRPCAERESSKWHLLRRRVHRTVRAAGFEGRLISVNDREGDAWCSLADAVERRHELLTRATQDRRLRDGGTLRGHLRRRPRAAEMTLAVHTRGASGEVHRRTATVQVRWARVTLLPPKNDPWAEPTPLPVVAIELYEAAPPPGVDRLHSRLLSTCETAGIEDVLQQVRWYGDRWGVEVGNDVVKNALDFEGLPLRDVAACTRVLALAGPVAAQVARWVALSRQSPPPVVSRVFEASTLACLGEYCRYAGVTAPGVWTVPGVVSTLGRLGGGDVRRNRPAGWRVVLRGWQRFEEFRALRVFLRDEFTRTSPTPSPPGKARGDP